MPDAKELLQSYIQIIRDPAAAAALFADDGIRFDDITFWIETPDKVFAEYVSDGKVA